VDSVVVNQLPLQLICLERGTDFITHKSTTGPLIIVGILLAVLRAVASS